MAGHLCNGDTENAAKPIKDSKAYCEGRKAAADGLLVGANPHVDGSDAATAWSTGFATWLNDPALGPDAGRDCCATPFGGGYTP